MSISYTDTQVAALKINEASLHAIYWNGNSWSAAPACSGCGVDTALNRVTLTADHVGAFAVVGTAGPTITSAAPPATAVIHAHYRHVFTASGSPAPSFHVSAGALPPGLSLDAATGVLEGAPTTLGTYAFAVAASNGALPDATQAVTLVVRSAIYMPLINSIS